jgi:hypothetical protein
MGRRQKFTYEKADAILARMEDSTRYIDACRAERIPPATFRAWMTRDLLGMERRFERAQAIVALSRREECLGLADAGGKTGGGSNSMAEEICRAMVAGEAWGRHSRHKKPATAAESLTTNLCQGRQYFCPRYTRARGH